VLLFDYFAGRSRMVGTLLENGFLNSVSISETLYVICRIDGMQKASKYVAECTGKVGSLASSERIAPLAGYMKCKFPVSLADCWALATAKSFNVACLFAFREKDVLSNLDSIAREVQIRFLDELQPS
jgi:hypothetical protein